MTKFGKKEEEEEEEEEKKTKGEKPEGDIKGSIAISILISADVCFLVPVC